MSYLPYEPQQQALLPHALQDWLPEGHLAYFISDTVDSLDLQAFHARYEGGGSRNQPFHPAMMVKVLVYAYATGVFSSRKIAKKLHEDVAFRVLAADNFPAHRTISDFRAFHLKELGELFVQVVRLAREMGLVKLGTIAVDGTKVKANASRHKAMSYGHMLKAEAELKAQIAALLQRAKTADQAEKNEPEVDIPAQIARRQDRLDAIAQARARLEQRQRETELGKGRDPDDRDNLGQRPKQVLADTGYRGESVFEQLANCDTDVIVSLGREGKKLVRFDRQRSPLTAQMADKLLTDKAKDAYRRRKWIAEPPNGWVKNVLGFRQFSMRGLHRVSAECKLVCMALNLRRMATLSAS